MVKFGLIIVGPAEGSIEIDPSFVLLIDHRLGFLAVNIVVVHHESDAIFDIGDHQKMEGVRPFRKNILPAPTDDDHVVLFLVDKRRISDVERLFQVGITFL